MKRNASQVKGGARERKQEGDTRGLQSCFRSLMLQVAYLRFKQKQWRARKSLTQPTQSVQMHKDDINKMYNMLICEL